MASQQKEDKHACRVSRKQVHVGKMLVTSRIAEVAVLADR